MRRLIHNDTVVRVISVLVSILLWMYVVGVNNPTVSVVLKGIPVQISNNDQFEASGLKIISVGNKTVDVRVEGRHSEVSKISANSIIVTLDVASIHTPGEYELDIALESESDNVTFTNVTGNTTSVFADYVVAVNKEIKVVTKGQPKQDFVVESVDSLDKQILVRGPKSMVDNISGAIAYIDITGADGDISKGCALSVVNDAGEEADLTYITTNITETMINVLFTHTKSVPIEAQFEDTAILGGYDVAIKPKEVKIVGGAETVKAITKINTATVPASSVPEVSEDSGDAEVSDIVLKASLELPEGITVAEGSETEVEVTLTAKTH